MKTTVTWQLRVTLDSIRNSCDVYHLCYTPDDNHDSHDDLDGNDYDGNDDFDVDQPARVIPVRMMPNEERMIGMRAKAEDQEIYCTCAKKRNIIDKMK